MVYRLVSDEALAPLAEQLSDEILIHLARDRSFDVVGESELEIMLAHERDKQAMRCDDVKACAARLSTIIHADQIVTGHLGKVGKVHVIGLKLADASKGVVERAEAVQVEDADRLRSAAREVAGRLLGSTLPPQKAERRLELAADRTTVAVRELKGHGVAPELAMNLTRLLTLTVKQEGLGVTSRSDIREMLRFHSERRTLQCDSDDTCFARIAGAYGVDYLVGGSVGRLGDTYVLTLKLTDVDSAEVVRRASESFRGSESDLILALQFATWSLLGRDVQGKGTLVVQANVDAGEVAVDGGEAQPYPDTRVFREVDAGRHGVFVASEGYVPVFRETYVSPGLRSELELQLEELPAPWYKKWWTWTIIGAVVVGGVATSVVLLQPDRSPTGEIFVVVE